MLAEVHQEALPHLALLLPEEEGVLPEALPHLALPLLAAVPQDPGPHLVLLLLAEVHQEALPHLAHLQHPQERCRQLALLLEARLELRPRLAVPAAVLPREVLRAEVPEARRPTSLCPEALASPALPRAPLLLPRTFQTKSSLLLKPHLLLSLVV